MYVMPLISGTDGGDFNMNEMGESLHRGKAYKFNKLTDIKYANKNW